MNGSFPSVGFGRPYYLCRLVDNVAGCGYCADVIRVGCIPAQSDALRVSGDAADPARQESRPARRSAAENRLRCPTPDNRRRDGSERNWIPRAIAGTGAIQHGEPKYRPQSGITGKGACLGGSQTDGVRKPPEVVK
jgi:hypothetical protein